jgi:hypothetical protein
LSFGQSYRVTPNIIFGKAPKITFGDARFISAMKERISSPPSDFSCPFSAVRFTAAR